MLSLVYHRLWSDNPKQYSLKFNVSMYMYPPIPCFPYQVSPHQSLSEDVWKLTALTRPFAASKVSFLSSFSLSWPSSWPSSLDGQVWTYIVLSMSMIHNHYYILNIDVIAIVLVNCLDSSMCGTIMHCHEFECVSNHDDNDIFGETWYNHIKYWRLTKKTLF